MNKKMADFYKIVLKWNINYKNVKKAQFIL